MFDFRISIFETATWVASFVWWLIISSTPYPINRLIELYPTLLKLQGWHFSLHGCRVVFSSKEPVLPIKWGHEGAQNGALSFEKNWERSHSWCHLMGRIWTRSLDKNPGIANLNSLAGLINARIIQLGDTLFDLYLTIRCRLKNWYHWIPLRMKSFRFIKVNAPSY